MEEKIQSIKDNLTGDFNKDIEFLNSLYDQENQIIEDARTTIEAINIVIKEINEIVNNQAKNEEVEVEENKEEKSEQELEIESLIDDLLNHIDEESDEEALSSIEELLPKIESLTKSDDNTIYCSFSNQLEKMLFEKIFAGEKNVIATQYANDRIYIIYADLLLKKKRRAEALEALDRAIYWNFLNREAREKKLDIYLKRKEIVKYLDTIKSLQMIAYTPQYIADCYNKYGYIFNTLNDAKSSYAMYKLSYTYFKNENVKDIINSFEEFDSNLSSLTQNDILKLAEDNDVLIGPNSKIVNAHRVITREFIENGMIEDAKIMLQNDYAITGNEEIANLYNQLLQLNPIKEDKTKSKITNKKSSTTSKKKTTSTAKKTKTTTKNKK